MNTPTEHHAYAHVDPLCAQTDNTHPYVVLKCLVAHSGVVALPVLLHCARAHRSKSPAHRSLLATPRAGSHCCSVLILAESTHFQSVFVGESLVLPSLCRGRKTSLTHLALVALKGLRDQGPVCRKANAIGIDQCDSKDARALR